jgi:hypothetical protein
MPWDLMGNSGTNPETNFLGTRDNQGLAIKTSAVDRVRIRANGFVGIGTTSPGTKLHIDGPAPADANDAQLRISESNGNFILVGRTRDYGFVQSHNREPLALNPLGNNVGIGTTSPGTKLHIDGPAPADANDAQLRISESNGNFILVGRTRDYGFVQSHNSEPLALNPLGNNVGIGTTAPVTTLHVDGSASKPGGGPWSVSSDVRLKKNVKPLKGALGKLLRLRGMRFEWKEPEKQGNLVGPQLGLVAQDVEEVFPEWVDTDLSGYKILTVRGFEALTVEAFRELKAENETLRMKNEELEDRIKVLELSIPEGQPSGNRNGAVR